MTEIESYYSNQQEPIKGTLLALKYIVLSLDKNISHEWKYGMPFFCYKGKMFCYLWIDKKINEPYLGIVEGALIHHPKLVQGKRARMKIIQFNANKDLPIKTIQLILKQRFYHTAEFLNQLQNIFLIHKTKFGKDSHILEHHR